MKQGLQELKQGLQELKQGPQELKQGPQELKQGPQELKQGPQELKQRLQELKLVSIKRRPLFVVRAELVIFDHEETIMTRPRNTIAEQLNAAQLAIANTLGDAEILSLVAGHGYPAETMSQGRELYEAAVSAVNAQRAAAGAQQDATQQEDEARKIAWDAYQALAKVARAIFADDKARLETLGLRGSMPQATAAFIAAATTLFDNAEGIPELAAYGYDAAKLASERAKIAAYAEANNRQEAAKGAAQQSTREQDEALKALNEWLAQYVKIAKVALREKAQLLEKIGVVARTSKTQAQREAPLKAAATRAAKTTE